MDVKESIKNITKKLHKYKYATLIVIIGLTMMVLPEIKKSEKVSVTSVQTESNPDGNVERNLSQILSRIQGAGDVYVMLTVRQSEEVIYQTDQDTASGADSGSSKTDTVIITDANRNETGLIRQTIPPQYMGAIIVCSGADNPTVRLAIVDAVSKVTGIGTNKISVLKTK